MFIDIAQIALKAGNGGNGCVSFHREKYVAAGGPDGGDGGHGGNILLVADDNLSTLADFRYKKKYAAANGEDGRPARQTGKKAADLLIRVPRGTLVKDAQSGKIITDICDDTPVIIARGGNGGWGNCHFANANRQVPRFAKPGAPGEELQIVLELKLLADVGLIGFPNVGKSTLVSVVSEAKPKIANYHFTTLTPVLGVVRLQEGTSFVMADIPGLIEGAGEGVGLGHEFLRHVERCRLLVHVLDIAGSEGRDPLHDFETINRELAVFSPELAGRPQVVVANKCDLTDDETIERYRAYFTEKGYAFFPVMAAIAHGTDSLIRHLAAVLATMEPIKRYESEITPDEIHLPVKTARTFTVRKENGVFYVENCDWLEPIMNTVDPDDYESLQYFERVLRNSGIIAALKRAGVNEGDLVNVNDFEMEYVL